MASIHEPNESKMIIGIPTNILSTVTSMSPLGQLKTILARKDASCLPQGMSIMNIVAGTVWLIYGMILDDILVIFPNIIAITMGIIQVTLIVLYSSRGKTSNTERPSQSVSTMGAINEENDLLVSGAISSTGSRTTKAPLITVAKAAAVFKKNKIFMGVHEKV
jgi:uncharacterized protein with PQ loop repeat